jgi:hypothetical protein
MTRTRSTDSTPDTSALHTGSTAPPEAGELEPLLPASVADGRRCGRCRRRFPVDPSAHPMELRDWWTCPACSDALMPGRHRSDRSPIDSTST